MLTKRHIKDLESIVGPKRLSTGESNLELHAKDQSQHPGTRPEAVIWPGNRDDVSKILRYANKNVLPVTGFWTLENRISRPTWSRVWFIMI
ncbi:MAG: FAD-binding oxidoreductase [Deltaproteobacteria bacterium]|nr:FAD-binding oxidoreductase [Deltaproteobacteria bacterium]